jgi:hypothetical protein
MAAWRQGDCVLGEHWFVSRFDPMRPLTAESRSAASESEADLAEEHVTGLVVVTQTCDIIRSCAHRPYVEVSPLISVEADVLRQIERGYRPAYASIPGVTDRGLVADLDRTMTVEKAVVARWERVPGSRTDAEERGIAFALARKRMRFAFPDDFTEFMRKLTSRLTGKHDKDSLEGRALRVLLEIRVHASPSWDADAITLTFWFVRSDGQPDFEGASWSRLLDDWLRIIPKAGRFAAIHAQVVALEDLTAADYLNSDRLDLDHLSSRGG